MANKQRKQKKTKKWIGWLILLVLLIIAMVATFLVWNANFKRDESGKTIEEKTTEEVETGEGNGEKVETDTVVDEDDYETGGKKVVQYEGENPNKAAELSGVVTYAGVVGENLMIRTNIDQFLGEGTCSLTISRDGATIYSETVAIVAEASTSTCQGFDVPLAALGNGAAQININLSSGGKTGALTSEVNL